MEKEVKYKTGVLRIKEPLGVHPIKKEAVLLANYLFKFKGKDILEMGCGTGHIAISLSKNNKVEGCDINKKAVESAKRNNLLNKTRVKFYRSYLFSSVKKKFDVIIFAIPFLNLDWRIMGFLESIYSKILPGKKQELPNRVISKALLFKVAEFTRKNLLKKFADSAEKHLNKNGKLVILGFQSDIGLIKKHSNLSLIKQFCIKNEMNSNIAEFKN